MSIKAENPLGAGLGKSEEARREGLMDHLHDFESRITESALDDLISLLTDHNRFDQLKRDQITDVGNYKPISVDGETFFDSPGSTGKDVSAILQLAKGDLGREAVLDDLKRLKDNLDMLEELAS